MTVPPRKSTPRFNPLVERKNTAARNMANEMTLNTSACRMNGMSRVKRKNSMVMPAPCSCLRRHRRTVGSPHLANRDLVELLSTAVDQRDDATRHEHRREHRGQNAEHVDDGETADRSRAERKQRDARDHRRDVRVENRVPSALVACLNGRMRRCAPAELFADALVNQHV